MSGTICEIIIRGNFSQSYARSMLDASQRLPEANDSIATAQILCSLGTTSYDGKEVMTDAQQVRATEIMGDFNAIAGAFVASLAHRMMTPPEFLQARAMCQQFNASGKVLIGDIRLNAS